MNTSRSPREIRNDLDINRDRLHQALRSNNEAEEQAARAEQRELLNELDNALTA